MLSDVLNRDDGELDIPVRPISLANLFGTIGMELTGISSHVIDKDSAMYVNNEYAEKTYMACSARISRSIKKLREISKFVSDNSKSYRLAETERNADRLFGDKFSFWGLEIYWRNALAKFKKLVSRVKTFLHKEK